jgi:hypothetical protein
MKPTRRALACTALTLASTRAGSAPAGAERPADEWSPAVPVTELNSTAADGCPFESPDGHSFYLASTRAGSLGGNDLWVANRRSKKEPWSTPVNLGPAVNSTANDFCPTSLPGHRLLFVSERPGPGTCNAGPGSGDIYFTRLNPAHGPADPRHLGCVNDGTGPNFDGPEFSASLVHTKTGTWLFFSSTGYDANMDLYVSQLGRDGTFGAPTKITELSTPADDRMPNVSQDGLVMVFSSKRTDLDGARGDFDVYISRRHSPADPWSEPVNLGPSINTAAAETRPSLSRDLDRLYFGRLGDIWLSNRRAGGT